MIYQGQTQRADQQVSAAAADALDSLGRSAAAVEALRALAHLAEEQSRYPLAMQLNTQALSVAEEVTGQASLLVAEVLGDLARLHRIDNRLEQAEAAATRALALRARHLGVDDGGAAPLLLILAYAEAVKAPCRGPAVGAARVGGRRRCLGAARHGLGQVEPRGVAAVARARSSRPSGATVRPSPCTRRQARSAQPAWPWPLTTW